MRKSKSFHLKRRLWQDIDTKIDVKRFMRCINTLRVLRSQSLFLTTQSLNWKLYKNSIFGQFFYSPNVSQNQSIDYYHSDSLPIWAVINLDCHIKKGFAWFIASLTYIFFFFLFLYIIYLLSMYKSDFKPFNTQKYDKRIK